MLSTDWRGLALKLGGLFGPLLFFFLPLGDLFQRDYFLNQSSSWVLALFTGIFSFCWTASSATPPGNSSFSIGRGLMAAAIGFNFVLFGSLFFQAVLNSPNLSSTGHLAYRWVFISLWGGICGYSIGKGQNSPILGGLLFQYGFLTTSFCMPLLILSGGTPQFQHLLFFTVPLYLIFSIFEQRSRKGVLYEILKNDPALLWPIHEKVVSAGDKWKDQIFLPHSGNFGFQIIEDSGIFILEAKNPEFKPLVNDRPVLNHPLKNGDRILSGSHYLIFEQPYQSIEQIEKRRGHYVEI